MLGKHLTSLGFEVPAYSGSNHKTQIDSDMLVEIAEWYADVKGNEKAKSVLKAFTRMGSYRFLEVVEEWEAPVVEEAKSCVQVTNR